MTVDKKEGKCGILVNNYKPCGRDLYDDEHCLFHSKDIEGKKEQFKDEFWKEFERQKKEEEILDFERFVFPHDISFKKIKFEKYANFMHAKFPDTYFFWYATFSKVANFQHVTFSNVYFWGTTFLGGADFQHATFSGGGFFRGATFSNGVNFANVNFLGEANFESTKFLENVSFETAIFSGGAKFEDATFAKKVYFQSATFSETAHFFSTKFMDESIFTDIKITEPTKINMTKTRLEDAVDLFECFEKHRKILKRTKKQELLPDDVEPILGTVTETTNPVYSRKVKDDLFLIRFQEKHPYMNFLWWLFADCGRSLLRWATWSLIFAIYFAVNFFLIDYSFTDAFKFNSPIIEKSFLSYVYYSVVTFTTLGFGDITPIISTAQKWVMAEVIIGYIMLGGLISILANKLARRS